LEEEEEAAVNRRADAANMAACCLPGTGGKYERHVDLTAS
jgi:hypothetical protein